VKTRGGLIGRYLGGGADAVVLGVKRVFVGSVGPPAAERFF
jgi:hypothetical protein